ncbi:MAG TPA: hypothetical protein VMS53_01300 [Burkholderiales bacterium]|nr:hypothetical protein [Burkholderiales bacterium]
MDQRTQSSPSAAAAGRYGDIALGVECAWPQITGAPTAAQGLLSSSSPLKRDSDVGSASFFRAAQVSLVALLLLAPALSADAETYAPQEYDFSELSTIGPSADGVVESVRDVRLSANPAELVNVFEHSLNAETGEELVVRLDDGSAVTVRLDGVPRFSPGERVRLLGGRVLRA